MGDPRDIVHDWPDALNSTIEALMVVIQKAEAAGKKLGQTMNTI